MTNPYYNHGSFPATNSAGASASMRAELDAIAAGFNKLPATLTANNIVFINSSGTALEARAGIDGIVIGGTTPAAGSFTTITLSSSLVLPAGSVGAPGAAFVGDTNNGWWAPAADTQAWSLAGAEAMRLNSTGLGIGMAPNAVLSVRKNSTSSAESSAGLYINTGTGAGTTGIQFGADQANGAGYIQALEPGVSFASKYLSLQPNGGKVVVGTLSTDQKFRVVSTDAQYAAKFENGRGDATGNGLWVDTRWNTAANIVARFSTNSGATEVLNLFGDSRAAFAGHVGIGTDPSYRLHVLSGVAASQLGVFSHTNASGYAAVSFINDVGTSLVVGSSGSTAAGWSQGLAAVGTTSASSLSFGTNSSVRMTIDSSGQVGIGTNAPSSTQLHVKSGSVNIAKFESTTARGSGAAVISIYDPTGNKGYFGYGSANDNLQISNQLNGTVEFYSNAALRMSITAAGVIQDASGLELGYKDIPRNTGSLTRGQCTAVTAGFTLNTGSGAGSTYSVYNDSAAAVTITQGAGLTLRLGGTTTTGNRTLAARGFATIWFNSTTEAIIQGSGVS